jgi:hypothetical protein
MKGRDGSLPPVAGKMGCGMRINMMKLVRMAVCGTIFSLVGFGVTALGQGQGQGQGQQGAGGGGNSAGGSQQQVGDMPPIGAPSPKLPGMKGGMQPADSNDPMAGRLEDAQAKSRNVERQKKLQADTERLLSLATELKQQVDKTDKNILSVDVIKKADEIERLAKSVKDRMKG